MKEITTIFFDFDGVLTLNKKGSIQTCESIVNISGGDIDRIKSSYFMYGTDINLGRYVFENIRDEFCKQAGISLEISRLADVFGSTPKNEDMFTLAKDLKEKGYTVGIITDNPLERLEFLRRIWSLDDIFDIVVVSSQVGGTKHDALIFETAFDAAKISPEQAIFIDNSPKNLIVPEAMGCKVFHHDDEKNNLSDLIVFLHTMGVL